jgi:hypothetical protein
MDETHDSYGIGDRYHWSWGLIDFGNATFQGAAHGLARLLTNRCLPEYISETSIVNRIDAMFHGADFLRRNDGSLEEAFPYEGSFCVTALVAFDLLSAVELLDDKLDANSRTRYINIVRPMISFLLYADETHAFISNHLATAAAALYKWHLLTGENSETRAQQILDLILQNQSNEGWFREYEGADPGYQTLCLYYLADIHRMRPDLGLIKPLRNSIQFLSHFAHPDGSFGGLYGSRNTRFYYPAGIEYLSPEIPEAASLSHFMRNSIEMQKVVTLSVMDDSNLIPMFNAYCWAMVCSKTDMDTSKLPCEIKKPLRQYWPEAGLLLDRGDNFYTIVSTHKGGVTYHYKDNELVILDAGIIARDTRGKLYSTQAFEINNNIQLDEKKVVIHTGFQLVKHRLPKPSQFLALRVMNLTIMRLRWLRERVKQLLVKMLITGKSTPIGYNTRCIHLGYNLTITDKMDADKLTRMHPSSPFVAIHMASQGYWQIKDDMN